jgi:hypothetical protein
MPEDKRPQEHQAVTKKLPKHLPSWIYEVGFAATAGWTVYLTTQSWKQGVGAGLIAIFGSGVRRGGRYLEKR